ncbi:class I SAM-dependent methyltransferase [Prauserella cavernicola]|uniref:Class I SAM-dependent methyltransferase n=1 Tax=Prauserella cavernicola TaxID=2800127 RepID=A0A934V2M1_9PSEU|nr:class I SAM-dependent methyltransferase [Prauserella cavernicola]MBK1783177.1 class I SAM-dependent methyltransferase [Prauserella cavernicola]
MITSLPAHALRAELLGSLRGTVLELGPGAGVNLPYYAPDVTWIGVEPAARHRARLRGTPAPFGVADVRDGRAERLDLPSGCVDAVVATYVLCSVDDPDAAISEIHRVLRPGGRYVVAEHVAAPDGTGLRRAQDIWGRVTGSFGARCRPNRRPEPAMHRAGFELTDVHRFVVRGPLGAGIPHIAGAAVRPAPTGRGTTP